MEPNIDNFYKKLKNQTPHSPWAMGFMAGIRERICSLTSDHSRDEKKLLMQNLKNYGPRFFIQLADDMQDMIDGYKKMMEITT